MAKKVGVSANYGENVNRILLAELFLLLQNR